jgi:hypothetical protein
VNKLALTGVVVLLLLVSVEALCQSETSTGQWDGSESCEAQNNKVCTWESLPDAPSADAGLPSPLVGTTGMSVVSLDLQSTLIASYATAIPPNSSIFFDRYLYPSLLNRGSRYRPVGGGGFVRRVTDAASRLLIMRDGSGNAKLNNSYLSAVMTSVVVQTANTPFWTRSASTPFSNLGSTLGSDAGLNVFHEFEPDIRQVILGHTPRFVSRIEDHISQSR